MLRHEPFVPQFDPFGCEIGQVVIDDPRRGRCVTMQQHPGSRYMIMSVLRWSDGFEQFSTTRLEGDGPDECYASSTAFTFVD
jgi:hypothetical protein